MEFKIIWTGLPDEIVLVIFAGLFIGLCSLALWLLVGITKEGGAMPKSKMKKRNVNTFIQEVVQEEGGKKQIDIAQGKELLRRINERLNGEVYRLIRTLDW